MTIYVLVAYIKQDNAPSDGHYCKMNPLKMIQDPILKLYLEMIMPDCMFSFFNYEYLVAFPALVWMQRDGRKSSETHWSSQSQLWTHQVCAEWSRAGVRRESSTMQQHVAGYTLKMTCLNANCVDQSSTELPQTRKSESCDKPLSITAALHLECIYSWMFGSPFWQSRPKKIN